MKPAATWLLKHGSQVDEMSQETSADTSLLTVPILHHSPLDVSTTIVNEKETSK